MGSSSPFCPFLFCWRLLSIDGWLRTGAEQKYENKHNLQGGGRDGTGEPTNEGKFQIQEAYRNGGKQAFNQCNKNMGIAKQGGKH